MSLFSNILQSTRPHVVITAPDGAQLWIDATPSANPDPAGASLWPQGFKVSIQAGDPPAAPNVTDSPSTYFVQQSPTLLQAPGPLGIPWGFWMAGAVALAVLPYAPLIARSLKK